MDLGIIISMTVGVTLLIMSAVLSLTALVLLRDRTEDKTS